MKTLVPEENCLTAEALLAYVEDRCSRDEVRRIDAHLTVCPLCSDALEGALSTPQYAASLTFLSDKLARAVPPRVSPLRVFSVRRWSQAAAAIAILVSAGYYFWPQPVPQIGSDVALQTPSVATPAPTMPAKSAPSPSFEADLKVKERDLAVVSAPPPISPLMSAPIAPPVSDSMGGFTVSPVFAEHKTIDSSPVSDDEVATESMADALQDSPTQRNDVAVRLQKEAALVQNQNMNANNRNRNSPTVAPSAVKKSKVRRESVYSQGLNAYESGDYAAAITAFESFLEKNKSGEAYEAALWYLANAYAAQGNKTAAKILLNRIVTERGRWANDAEVLLRTLR